MCLKMSGCDACDGWLMYSLTLLARPTSLFLASAPLQSPSRIPDPGSRRRLPTPTLAVPCVSRSRGAELEENVYNVFGNEWFVIKSQPRGFADVGEEGEKWEGVDEIAWSRSGGPSRRD